MVGQNMIRHRGRNRRRSGLREAEQAMNEIKPDVTSRNYKYVGTRPIRPDGVPKVTGAARYGADYAPPGMIWGKALRSPHPHAKILSIDTSKAEMLAGVHAVVTGKDFPSLPNIFVGPERLQRNAHYDSCNIMARDKVLYHGHILAAVAAKDEATAKAAVELIVVEY